MKAHLMYPDRDFQLDLDPVTVRRDLVQDLELDTLWQAMAGSDGYLLEISQAALLAAPTDPDGVRFRQAVLTDCVAHVDVVQDLYRLSAEAIAADKKVYRSLFNDRGGASLRRSVDVLELFVVLLRQLRAITDEHASMFGSAGFSRFFAQLREELCDDYFAEIAAHLSHLRFRDGIVMSGRLGDDNIGTDYVLRTPRPENQSGFWHRTPMKKPTYTLTVADRDEAGIQALGRLRDRGLDPAAKALAQSVAHVLGFFVSLRAELGFYLACLNLRAALQAAGQPLCLPDPHAQGSRALRAVDLRDPCLALHLRERVVGNDVDADDRNLVIVTGANQGGKSTFLRSLGLAQLMMQCGMFVPAESFAASVVRSIFTHYQRVEDPSMSGGKFDEELARMSRIADEISPDSLLLCNESFASTNELEGAHIGIDVVRAMNDAHIRVVYVTHMFELADRLREAGAQTSLFLRAQRGVPGARPFHLDVGDPLPTSYGEDLYRRTFGDDG